MGQVHLPGTVVQDFTLVELAGDGTQSNVYLARRDGIYYWLLQLEDKNFDPQVVGARVERFELSAGNPGNVPVTDISFDHLNERWITLPVAGTSIVNLASWVDRLEVPFIGWRWAILAKTVGLLHEDHKVMQHSNSLSLERLRFSEEAELIFAQADPYEKVEYVFTPPEGLAKITPAGDVYSLAASLQALLGKDVPFAVQPILARAMLPLPEKRFKDAREFGEELADVLPDPNRVKQPKPPRPARSNFKMACIGVAALLFVCCLFISCSTIYTITSPDFKRQVQEMQRQIQEQQQR